MQGYPTHKTSALQSHVSGHSQYSSQSASEYDKEQAELDVIGLYLPEPLSHIEVMQIIEKVISEVDASGPQDMGKVMGKIIPQTRGRADGKQISSKVEELLRKITE